MPNQNIQIQATLDSKSLDNIQQQLAKLTATIHTIQISAKEIERLSAAVTISPTLDTKKILAEAQSAGKNISDIFKSVNEIANPSSAVSSLSQTASAFTGLAGALGVVSTALGIVTSLMALYNQKQEETRQNLTNLSNFAGNRVQEINTLAEEYNNIIDSTQTEIEKTKDLEKWKQKLVEVYGFERDALKDINLERETGIGLLTEEKKKYIDLALAANGQEYAKAVELFENKRVTGVLMNSYTNGNGIRDITYENLSSALSMDIVPMDMDGKIFSYSYEAQGEYLEDKLHKITKALSKFEDIKDTLGPLTKAEQDLYDLLEEQLGQLYKEMDASQANYNAYNSFMGEKIIYTLEAEGELANVDDSQIYEGIAERITGMNLGFQAQEIALTRLAEMFPQFSGVLTQTEYSALQAADALNTMDSAYPTKSMEAFIEAFTGTIEEVQTLEGYLDTLREKEVLSEEQIKSFIKAYPEVFELANNHEELITLIEEKIIEMENAAIESLGYIMLADQETVSALISENEDLFNIVNGLLEGSLGEFEEYSDGKYLIEEDTVTMLQSLWSQHFKEISSMSSAALNNIINNTPLQFVGGIFQGAKGLLDDWKENLAPSKKEDQDKKEDPSFNFNRPSGTSPSSASAKDTHKEAFDTELKELQYQRDAKLLSEEEYLNRSLALNDQYFKDQEKYAEQYRQNVLKDSQTLEKLQEDKINKQISNNEKMLKALSEDPALNSEAIVSLIHEQETLQQQLYGTAAAQREHLLSIGFQETDREILELDAKLLDLQSTLDKIPDSIYSHYNNVLQASFTETDAAIDRHKENIAGLDSAYRELADNQMDEKLSNINARIGEQTAIANLTADKIDSLNQCYHAGEISLADYNSALKTLNQEQRSALSSLTGLDKELERQVDLVMDAYYSYKFDEKQKEINALQSQMDEISQRYQKQINLIDDEIAALRERNKEAETQKKLQERIYELEKLQLELENVRNEKNIRQLTRNDDGSYDFTYVADQEKIDSIQERIQKTNDGIQDIYKQDALEAQIKVLEERKNSLNQQMDAEKNSLSEMVNNLQTFLDEEKDKYSNRNKLLITSEEELRESLKGIDASMYAERLEYLDIFENIFREKAAGLNIGVQVDDDISSVGRFWEQVHQSNQSNYEQEETDMRHSEEQKTDLRHKAIEQQKADEDQKNKDLIKKLKNYMEEVLTRTKSHDETVALMADQMRVLLNSIDSLMYSERLSALEAFVDAWNAEIARMEQAAILEGGSGASYSMGAYSKGGIVPQTGVKLLHEGERVLTVTQTKLFEKAMDHWPQMENAIANASLTPSIDAIPPYMNAITSKQVNASNDVHINHLTLNQPNVKNVNDFAKAMENFPTLVKQAGYR